MSDLLSKALEAMNSNGLTSNVFTQENKQPVVEQPAKVDEPEVVAINPEE